MNQIAHQIFPVRKSRLALHFTLAASFGLPLLYLAPATRWRELSRGGELEIWLGFLALLLAGGLYFLVKGAPLPRAAVALDAEGIWPLHRGRGSLVRWREIAAVRCHNRLDFFELLDDSGRRRLRVSYELDGIQELAELMAERLRPPHPLPGPQHRFRLGSILLGVVLVATFAGLVIASLQHRGWRDVVSAFCFGGIALLSQVLWKDLSLEAAGHRLVIRRLLSKTAIEREELLAVELEHQLLAPFSRYRPALRLQLATGPRFLETPEPLLLKAFLDSWQTRELPRQAPARPEGQVR